MKKLRFLAIPVIAIFLVALIVFIDSTMGFQCSSDEARLKLFYNEKKDSLTTVFFGSSSVRADWIPTIAYEESGFTSYDYTINHMPLPAIKFMIEEVMQTQSPELIIIDINGITYCNREFTEKNSANFTNSIKDGENKNNALSYLFKDYTWENEIGFIKFHRNYHNLSLCFKFRDYYERYGTNVSILKGYTTNQTLIEPFESESILDYKTVAERRQFNKYEQKSVEDLLDYCDKINNKTNILFVRLPRITIENNNDMEIEYINTFADMIAERGYDYINNYDMIEAAGIDLMTDFCDNTHLNHFGAEKFTRYFSNYLLTKYDLKQEVNEKWNKCCEYANQYYEVIKEYTLNGVGRHCYEFNLAEKLNKFGVK